MHEDDVRRWIESAASTGYLNASWPAAAHCPKSASTLHELAAMGIEALRDDLFEQHLEAEVA